MSPSRLSVPVSALTLMVLTLTVVWQEGHASHMKPCSSNPRGFLPEQVEEEDPRGNWLTQVHMEKWSSSRSSGDGGGGGSSGGGDGGGRSSSSTTTTPQPFYGPFPGPPG